MLTFRHSDQIDLVLTVEVDGTIFCYDLEVTLGNETSLTFENEANFTSNSKVGLKFRRRGDMFPTFADSVRQVMYFLHDYLYELYLTRDISDLDDSECGETISYVFSKI
mgnify:CR=1 FL=1